MSFRNLSLAVREHLNEHHDDSVLWDQAHRNNVVDALKFVVELARCQEVRSSQTAEHDVAAPMDIRVAESDCIIASKLRGLLDEVIRRRRGEM